MRRDIFLYLSGPITPKHGRSVENNVANALAIYWQCFRLGLPAFCPQATAIFPAAWSDVPYESWMEYDFCVIDRCTHVVLLPHWEQSTGAVREVDYARQQGVRIISHTDLETL